MATTQTVPGRQTSRWMRDWLNDPDIARAKAEEARATASEYRDAECRRIMERIAEDYDRMAERLEREPPLLTWPALDTPAVPPRYTK